MCRLLVNTELLTTPLIVDARETVCMFYVLPASHGRLVMNGISELVMYICRYINYIMKTYRPTRLRSTPSIGGGGAPPVDNAVPLYEVVRDIRHNSTSGPQQVNGLYTVV